MSELRGIAIVYQDDYLAVIDKPAGLLVVPTPKKETRTLTGIVNSCARTVFLCSRLYPVHRLDRETSGLIIYAKNRDIERRMAEQFRRRQITKKYIALVQGNPLRQVGTISSPIDDNPMRLRRFRRNPKSALTRYRALAQRKGYSIVEVIPVTGRTNQIRIHMQQIGHPLLGERKYAFGRDYPLKFKRVALHATFLKFRHPITGQEITLHSDLPADLESFIKEHQ